MGLNFGNALEVGRLFASMGIDTGDYNRGLDDAERRAHSFGQSLAGSFQRIAETATGVLIGQALPRVIGGLQSMASEALNAVASQERLGMALENLAKRDILAAGMTEKMVSAGQVRIQLTAAEREKLEDLGRQRDILAIKMKEEELRHQELVKRYGEEGLATQRHALEMAGMRDKYDELSATIGKLEGKSGTLVEQFKKVTNQTITDAQAKEMASKASEDLLRWIEKLAVKSPFEADDVAQAFRLASNYGFVANAAADLAVKSGKLTAEQRANTVSAERLTQAMLDLVAGTGSAPEVMADVTAAMGKMKASGKVTGEVVESLTKAGINVDAILAKAFGKSTAEIIKMREKGLIPADKAILAITQSIETNFGGAAERQTQTLSGLMSSMADLKTINLREFFEGTFKSVQPYISKLVDWLSSDQVRAGIAAIGEALGNRVAGALQTIQNLVGAFQSGGAGGLAQALGLTPAVGELIQRIAGGMADLATTVRTGLGAALAWLGQNVMPAVNQVIQYIVDNWPAFEGALKGIGMALVAGGVLAAVAGLASALMTLINPVTLLIALAAGIGAAWETNFLGIRDTVQPILDKLAAVFETIKTKVGEVVSAFQAGGLSGGIAELLGLSPEQMTAIEGFFDRVGQFIGTFTSAFSAGLSGDVVDTSGTVTVLSKVRDLGLDAGRALDTIRTKVGEVVGAFQTGGLAAVLQELGVPQETLSTLAATFERIGNFLAGLFAPTIERLKQGFADFTAGLPSLQPLLEPLVGAFQNLWNALQPVFQALGAIAGVIGGALIAAFNLLLEIVAGVMGSLPELIGNAITIVTEIINGLADLIRGVVDVIKKIIEGDWAGAWETAKATVTGLWEHIVNIFTTIVDTITTIGADVITAIGTWAQNVVDKVKEFFGIASPSTVFAQFGTDLVNGLLGGIMSMAGALLSGVVNFFETNIKRAVDFAGMLVDAGRSIIQGLWDGISGMGQQFADWLIGWLKTWVPGVVLKFLGIESPSKMFIEIGKQIIAGLIEGIKAMGSDAANAMVDTLNNVINAVNGIVQVLDNINSGSPVVNLREKLAAIIASIQTIVLMFGDLAQYYGTAAGGAALRSAKAVLDPLAEVAQALSGVLGVFKPLSELPKTNGMRERLTVLRQVIVDVINTLAVIGEGIGQKARERLKAIALDLGLIMTTIGSIFEPLRQAFDFMAHLEAARVPSVGPKMRGVISLLMELANSLAKVGSTVGDAVLARAATAAQRMQIILEPWQKAIEIVGALADHTDRVIGLKANRLASQMMGLARNLQQWADQMTPAQMARAVKAAGDFVTTLKPWQKAIEIVGALADHTDRVIGPKANRLASQMMGLARNLQQWADQMTPAQMARAMKAAGDFVTTLEPWQKAIEIVGALADHTDRVIGPKANRLASQMMGLARNLQQWADQMTPAQMARAVKAAGDFVTTLEPWQKAIDVVRALADHTDRVIGPKANRLASQMMGLARNLQQWADKMTPAQMARAVKAAGDFVTTLEPWQKAIDVVRALAGHADRVIGPIANRLASQMMGLARNLQQWADQMTPAQMARAVEAAGNFTKILEPWDKALDVVRSLKTWRILPDIESRFDRLLRFWREAIFTLARVATVVDRDGLAAAVRFAQAIGDIADGLRAALELGLAVPTHWEVPRAWAAFEQWVMDVFQSFYDWVNRTTVVAVAGGGTIIVPAFSDEGMGAMSTFAAALSDLMGALQTALELSLALPATWTVPAAWGAFEQWVMDVFTDFYDWITSWGAPPSQVPRFGDEEMDLVGQFAGALNDLMGALLTALQVATALPATWTVPTAWDTFEQWVRDVFEGFAGWILGWGTTNPVPIFNGEEMDLVSQFAGALNDLMGALQTALDVALGLPATWTVPAAWDTFQNWVRDVFMDFATWLLGWGTTNPVPIFTQGELDLIGQFAEAMGALFSGLQAALVVASGLPANWVVPEATWEAFKAWVLSTMEYFITWVETYMTQHPGTVAFAAVTEFGNAMQAVFGGLLAALELFAAINTWVGPGSEFQTRLTNFLTLVETTFSDLTTYVTGNFTTTALQLMSTFGSALSTVVGALSASLNLFSALAGTEPGVFTPNTETLVFERRMQALMMAIGITITAFQTYIATEPNQLWFPTASAFFSAVDLMMGILGSALDLFADLENANLPDPQEIQDFVDAVLALFVAFATGLLNSGTNIGITATGIYGTVGEMPAGVLEYTDPLQGAGATVVGAIGIGMTQGQAAILAAGSLIFQKIDGLKIWLLDQSMAFEYRGTLLVTSLAAGLTAPDPLASIGAAGTTMMNSLWNAWNPEANQAGVWAGQQAAAGIVTGLQSGSGAIWQAAYNLAQQIIAGLNAGLIIGSPSRATAQIGAWAGQGLVDGFASKADLMAVAVDDMIGGMVDPMQSLGLALVTAFAGGMSGGFGAVDTVLESLGRRVTDLDPIHRMATLLEPPIGLSTLSHRLDISNERRVHLTVDFQNADYLPPSVINALTNELVRAVRTNA